MANIGAQSERMVSIPVTRIRNAKTTAAIFGAVPTKAATEVGAPSYTSGIHIWNGTAPNLNAMATTINTIPNFNNHSLACSLKAEAKTEAKSREPVAP